jgi:hypothetical protein
MFPNCSVGLPLKQAKISGSGDGPASIGGAMAERVAGGVGASI